MKHYGDKSADVRRLTSITETQNVGKIHRNNNYDAWPSNKFLFEPPIYHKYKLRNFANSSMNSLYIVAIPRQKRKHFFFDRRRWKWKGKRKMTKEEN